MSLILRVTIISCDFGLVLTRNIDNSCYIHEYIHEKDDVSDIVDQFVLILTCVPKVWLERDTTCLKIWGTTNVMYKDSLSLDFCRSNVTSIMYYSHCSYHQ